ncbi:MAG TPA: diguanylate cyclase [Candidatus Nanopelagicales bacterium]|nr:diguanylate cyclase [Candidatus Nanopelagicales bacterium]
MSLTDRDIATTVEAVLPREHPPARHPDAAAQARAAASPAWALVADGYREVGHQASVALFVTDAAGLIIDANPATAALLGRPDGGVVGLSIADITHPDDVETSRARLDEALRTEVATYRVGKRYVRGDGSTVRADVTVTLLRGSDGLPAGFLAAAVDDTERLAAEEHARAAGALLRATVDAFPDPWVYLVAVRSPDGAIVDFVYADANRAACEHNGTTREELLGRRLLDVLPEHQGALLARYASVVDTGRSLLEDDVPFPTAGQDRYFSNRAVAVGEDGLSLTWRDTTEQVRQRQDLATRAVTDPLTGLFNRAGLDDSARSMRLPGRRLARGAAVLYVDLDGLGEINRVHGHGAGDKVLCAVADRIDGAVRGDDVVARVGGDEFVVLAPGADDDGAHALALKLAEAVTRPVLVADGIRIVPTVTVGVTVGDSSSHLADLVERADQSMLSRKRHLYAETGRYSDPAPDVDVAG